MQNGLGGFGPFLVGWCAMAEEHFRRLGELRRDFLFSVVVQLVVVLVASTILDGGHLLRMCLIAVAAHWLTVGIIAARRKNALTRADTFMIRLAFLIYIPIAYLLAEIASFIADKLGL